MGWQSYLCPCGNLACRLAAQPCGKCGRMLGPVTNKSQRRELLKSLGWRRSGSYHWRGRDGRLYTLGAAYRAAVAGIPRIEGKKEKDIGIIRLEEGAV